MMMPVGVEWESAKDLQERGIRQRVARMGGLSLTARLAAAGYLPFLPVVCLSPPAMLSCAAALTLPDASACSTPTQLRLTFPGPSPP